MKERLFTIDEVCKIITLTRELYYDGNVRGIRMYLKWLCETFDEKVDIENRTLIKNAYINAKYRTSPNCILSKLEKSHEIHALFKYNFTGLMKYNFNRVKTVTRDNRKVKLIEVLKDDKFDYPVIGIIEGENENRYWSKNGEFIIGKESNNDIFYIDTIFDEHLKYYKKDIFKIL